MCSCDEPGEATVEPPLAYQGEHAQSPGCGAWGSHITSRRGNLFHSACRSSSSSSIGITRRTTHSQVTAMQLAPHPANRWLNLNIRDRLGWRRCFASHNTHTGPAAAYRDPITFPVIFSLLAVTPDLCRPLRCLFRPLAPGAHPTSGASPLSGGGGGSATPSAVSLFWGRLPVKHVECHACDARLNCKVAK